MNKDKIKKLLQDKLEPPFWDSDFYIIHEVYVNEIKEMIAEEIEKYTPAYEEEDKAIVHFGKFIITKLTQDTNPKE